MCFGKVFVTLLSLPWLNGAAMRYGSQTEIKMLSHSNNTVFILYKTPPLDMSQQQLGQMLEKLQWKVSHHLNMSTCTPGDNTCIITHQCSSTEAVLLNISEADVTRNATCTWLTYDADQHDSSDNTLTRPDSFKVWSFGMVSVGIISLSGLFGGLFWPLINSNAYNKLMCVLIGLAVGSLTATSTFQLIPEGFELKELKEDYLDTAVFMWGSLWTLYMCEVLSKIIFHKPNKNKSQQVDNSKHIHRLSSFASNENLEETRNGIPEKDVLLSKVENTIMSASQKNEREIALPTSESCKIKDDNEIRSSVKPTVAYMIILGDSLHNFIDGMSIGAGYSKDLSAGLGISIAIACEEFPHELGDFAILINSGMPFKKALLYNFLSACTAFGGCILGILMGELEVNVLVFAFAGGLFLYVSLADLMPELNRMVEEKLDTNRKSAFLVLLLQNCGIFLGVTTLYLITRYPITIS